MIFDNSFFLYCAHYGDVKISAVVSVCLSVCLCGALLYSVFVTNKRYICNKIRIQDVDLPNGIPISFYVRFAIELPCFKR